ncbi:helix-turn-helix transcriptional regulator [Mesorhizobium sp. M0243]|uniref:helix-turn-helix domain-containing protein n=1 Tax=Mesorhizobium sp. M0243 TaxID=2956925 RepID=UPI00333D6A2E
MDARKIIGWNLRKFRVAKGLSQEKLALEAGIDRSYVGRVERGSENVTISTLELIAAVLQVTVAALLEEPESGSPRPQPLSSGRKRRGQRSAE